MISTLDFTVQTAMRRRIFMKKTTLVLICILFFLTILYPAGVLIASLAGYSFKLASVSGMAIALTVLSLGLYTLGINFEDAFACGATKVLAALITPFSLINTVFFIAAGAQKWVVALMFVCAGCSCYFGVKYAKPAAAKLTALILAGVIAVPVVVLGLVAFTTGGFNVNAVVQSVDSPNGKYYAEVVNNDVGTFGGNTFVDIYEKGVQIPFLFKAEKKVRRAYSGPWGEFNDMQIYWKNDRCLVINSIEYEIEG